MWNDDPHHAKAQVKVTVAITVATFLSYLCHTMLEDAGAAGMALSWVASLLWIWSE